MAVNVCAILTWCQHWGENARFVVTTIGRFLIHRLRRPGGGKLQDMFAGFAAKLELYAGRNKRANNVSTHTAESARAVGKRRESFWLLTISMAMVLSIAGKLGGERISFMPILSVVGGLLGIKFYAPIAIWRKNVQMDAPIKGGDAPCLPIVQF